MQAQIKMTELKKTVVNQWKAMKTVQFTSISVSTKGKKQVGTIWLSKYTVYIQDVPNPNMLYMCKVCPKSAQTVSKC